MTFEEIDIYFNKIADYSVFYSCAIHESGNLIKGGNNYWIHWIPKIEDWDTINKKIYREGWVLCDGGNTLRKFIYPITTNQPMFMYRDFAESNGIRFGYSKLNVHKC